MRRYGLIGFPLSHSFSAGFFAEKFKTEGIDDAVYELYPLARIEELSSLLQNTHDLQGLNVTIPYKESVLVFLNEVSEEVKKIGACNCIKKKDDRLVGYNTDAPAFLESLREKLLPHHRQALILGTGGASKAVAYVLQQLGIAYRFVSRKPLPGGQVLTYEQLSPAILEQYTLIINTTPVGLYPNAEAAPLIPYESIDERHYLFDLIYNPEKTLFLRQGEKRGAAIKNGHEMLILQAIESWRIWNDPDS